MLADPKIKEGLYLFKALIKDGCEWHGDVFDKQWSERLYIPNPNVEKAVLQVTLSMYDESIYKRDGSSIWIY